MREKSDRRAATSLALCRTRCMSDRGQMKSSAPIDAVLRSSADQQASGLCGRFRADCVCDTWAASCDSAPRKSSRSVHSQGGRRRLHRYHRHRCRSPCCSAFQGGRSQSGVDSSLPSWDRDHFLFFRGIIRVVEMNRMSPANPGQSWVLPCGFHRRGSHPAALGVTFFDAIERSRSFQDSTNDLVPSRCRSAASWS